MSDSGPAMESGKAQSFRLHSVNLFCVPGSGSRTGATLQTTAVSVSPRARTSSERFEAHVNPGEDLVPESSLQKQKTEASAGRNDQCQQVPATAASHRSASSRAGW